MSEKGTPAAPGFKHKAAHQQRDGIGGSEPDALRGTLGAVWLQVVLSDLGCLQRLAETLGVSENGTPQAHNGPTVSLGFAHMCMGLTEVLSQLQDAPNLLETTKPQGERPDVNFRVSAATALATEVVTTARRVFLGEENAKE